VLNAHLLLAGGFLFFLLLLLLLEVGLPLLEGDFAVVVSVEVAKGRVFVFGCRRVGL